MVQSTPVIAVAISRYLIQTDWERMGKAVIGFFLYVKLFQSYKSLIFIITLKQLPQQNGIRTPLSTFDLKSIANHIGPQKYQTLLSEIEGYN